MKKVLCLGDFHVTDGQDLSRFSVISRFIVENKPEYIILMGDFMTFQCLSAWDMDKRARMEGQRYALEIKAGNDALDLMFKDLEALNKRRRSSKNKQYKPKLVFIEGNHEDRLTRYLAFDPTFQGHVSVVKDLSLKKRGFEFIPYREYKYINDVGFTHIPFNKAKEISGVDITRKASMVTVKSVVFAHTHGQNLCHVHKEGMPHLQDIYVCGCVFDEKEDYIHGRVTEYWRGITILNIWKKGRFDIDAYSISRLRHEYGEREV